MDAQAWQTVRHSVSFTGDANYNCNAPSSSAGENDGHPNIWRREDGLKLTTAYPSVLYCSMVESVVT
eukprot:4370036-Karenia_brevis.AAC.1